MSDKPQPTVALTVEQVGALLGCPANTLRDLISTVFESVERDAWALVSRADDIANPSEIADRASNMAWRVAAAKKLIWQLHEAGAEL
jgi:hypothetical protein